MPLVKNQSAAPAMKQAVVLDLADISAQAARIRMDAETKAQRIIAQAEEQAAKLVEEAQAKAHEQGLEEGLRQGTEQGIEQGTKQAFEEHAEALGRIAECLADTASSWEQARLDLLREARDSVLKFAVELGEKLAFRQIETDDAVVIDQAEAALRFVLGETEATMRLHPEDVPLVAAALPDLLSTLGQLQHVHLEEDAEITRGGCTVAFGQGSIDATIETQTRRLADLILPPPSDAIALKPDASITPEDIPGPQQGGSPENEVDADPEPPSA